MNNDKLLKIVMLILAASASSILLLTIYKLVSVENQVETNKSRIEELEKPCTDEDVLKPEMSPACQ